MSFVFSPVWSPVWKRTAANALLTLPFLVLFLVQLSHHALWRDELNAFGIAVGSSSLTSLFAHIHYEGHPWLWYTLLWGVSKFTVYPVGMKVLEAWIGAGTLCMIGLASPFTRLEKVLLLLSYFVTFEYTVLSRMYGVMLLLTLLYVQQRTAHPARTIRNSVLLGLIASTDSMGIILSGALALEYALSFYQMRQTRRIVGGALVWTALVLFSLWSLKLSPDVSWRTTGHMLTNARDIKHLGNVTLSFVAMPYLPVTTLHLGPFWNPNPWDHRRITVAVFLFVVAAYWYTFRRERNLLFMLGLVVAGSIAFGHFIYYGSERHFGVTFLAFVVGLWVIGARRGRLPWAASLLLALCAFGGVLTNFEEWRRPWSNAANTVAWLESNGLASAPIAGTPDTSVSSLGELMHRTTYQLDCNCSNTFMLFSRRRDSFSTAQIPDRIVLARRTLGPHMLYIGAVPLSTEEQHDLAVRGLPVHLLQSFTGSEIEYEDFYIYGFEDPTATLAARQGGSTREQKSGSPGPL